MKYGNATLSGKFVLGPMAGYSDIAFRLLCRRNGAAMCFTEFSNAEALVRDSSKGWAIVQTCKEEMPVGIQIFGSEEKAMANACRMISERVQAGGLQASCIDLNFGCPSGSVIRAGAGSALLRKPEKMAAIAKACVAASEIPVTAKIRAGWSKDDTLSFAKLLEKQGISGICIHWRTATEGRKRQEGWSGLAKVKQALEVPLIGNGGASTPERAVRFLSETGCDAVMISSAALGNPAIFVRANSFLKGKPAPPQAWEEKLRGFMEYSRLAEKYGILSPKRLRLHAQGFLSSQGGAKGARRRLNLAKSIGEITEIMESFAPSGSQPGYSCSSDMKT